MLAVEPRGRDEGEEELAAVGGGAAGIGGREQAGLRVLDVGAVLPVELVARTSAAGAERAPALRHEPGDDAVEGEAVEVPELGQIGKARDVHRRDFGQELDQDRALVGHHARVVRLLGIEGHERRLGERRAPVCLRLVRLGLRDLLFELLHDFVLVLRGRGGDGLGRVGGHRSGGEHQPGDQHCESLHVHRTSAGVYDVRRPGRALEECRLS